MRGVSSKSIDDGVKKTVESRSALVKIIRTVISSEINRKNRKNSRLSEKEVIMREKSKGKAGVCAKPPSNMLCGRPRST